MSKNVADTSLTHCMHRDTICQTVAFVRAGFVQRETCHKCFMTLWRNFDIRAAENSFSLNDCAMAGLFAILRKEFKSSTSTSSVVISLVSATSLLAAIARSCHWSLGLKSATK